MAPRNVDQNTASQVVQDSLGMSADDLGMDREDTFAGLDDDLNPIENDEGDDNQNQPLPTEDNLDDDLDFNPTPVQPKPQPKTTKPDDLRVSHTADQNQRGNKLKEGLSFDKRGNIVNKEGRVVANAGREARLYQSNERAREQVASITTQANERINDVNGRLTKAVNIGMQLSERLNALKEQGSIATRAGLSDTEHAEAVEFARLAKTPEGAVQVLKTLLTKAATSGIDLSSLGIQPGGFDSKSLLDMVRAEIAKGTAPVVAHAQTLDQQRQATLETEQARTAVQQEINDFFGANPEAKAFLPAITKIMESPASQGMTLPAIWDRIQLNLLRRGIDPKNPGQSQQTERSSDRRTQPRLPNGRGNPPGETNGRITADGLAPVDMTYEDILRSVMGNSR